MSDYIKGTHDVCETARYVLTITAIWLYEPFYSQTKEEFCKVVQSYQDYITEKKPESVLKKACARFIYLAMCPALCHVLCNGDYVLATSSQLSYYQLESFHDLTELEILHGLVFHKVTITTNSKYNVYVSYMKEDKHSCKNLCDFPGILGFKIIMSLCYPGITKICKWD